MNEMFCIMKSDLLIQSVIVTPTDRTSSEVVASLFLRYFEIQLYIDKLGWYQLISSQQTKKIKIFTF